MKENKVMAQEIWQISIFHTKTSKEFCNEKGGVLAKSCT